MLDATGTCEFPKCREYSYDRKRYCPHHHNEIKREEEKNESILKLGKEIELLRIEICEIKRHIEGAF